MKNASSDPGQSAILHATCVALDQAAVLVIGASGSGKSALALQLMALGAQLVADDRTNVIRHGQDLFANAPASLTGLIEARGVGILRADHAADARLGLVVDMDRLEEHRLPAVHRHQVLGLSLPCLHKVDAAHFPAAILQYLKGGIRDPS